MSAIVIKNPVRDGFVDPHTLSSECDYLAGQIARQYPYQSVPPQKVIQVAQEILGRIIATGGPTKLTAADLKYYYENRSENSAIHERAKWLFRTALPGTKLSCEEVQSFRERPPCRSRLVTRPQGLQSQLTAPRILARDEALVDSRTPTPSQLSSPGCSPETMVVGPPSGQTSPELLDLAETLSHVLALKTATALGERLAKTLRF